LKAKLLPIDVPELERLISKTDEARKQIEDKDVLFVIGTTGSGKSTNILKFLGYNLRKSTYKGLSTLTPV
jgi:HrpA-like RNA helicase